MARNRIHLDNVKAIVDVCSLETAHPGTGAFGDELLLGKIDSLVRSAERNASACFHLDEYKSIALSANDVHFAATSCAKIAAENLIAAGFEKLRRQLFALAAQFMPRIGGARRKEPTAPPGEKNGDGSGRGHPA